MLTLGVVLSGCTASGGVAPAGPEAASDLFEQYDIVTGSSEQQTVLPGFFLGGPAAEIAVVHRDESGHPRVQMYGFDGDAWVSVLEARLGTGVLFVDVASDGGRDRLVTYERGRLSWFDPETATERALIEVAASYRPTGEGGVPHVDITRDVNGDGRDDLMLPDVDGFWISTQRTDGSFAEAVKLGPPEPFRDAKAFGDERTYGESGITAQTTPWYLSRVREMDYDQDGLSDLVFWNEDHFDVHLQDAGGRFDPEAVTFTAEVPFDSDGVYSMIFGFGDASMVSLVLGFRKKTRSTVLHSIRDMNGDGVADLVTQSLKGRSVLRLKSWYEVHFGSPTADGISFEPEVSVAIRTQGSARGGGPPGYSPDWWQDFDGDGQVDIMLGRVRTGIGGMFRALVTKSIAMDVEYYRIEGGVFPDTPTGSRRIKPDSTPFGGRGPFFPTVLVGDVNGDGRADLLAGENWEELKVFLGVPGPELFSSQPHRVAVALTANERDTRLIDLNADGKQDLLLHHPSTTEPHRLTMLIAR